MVGTSTALSLTEGTGAVPGQELRPSSRVAQPKKYVQITHFPFHTSQCIFSENKGINLEISNRKISGKSSDMEITHF